MGMLLRIVGLWLLGLALILLVIDGTRMLAANAFVMTPLAETWDNLLPETLAGLEALLVQNLHPALWDPTLTTILAWPGWVVFGVAGLLLAFIGRRRHRRSLIVSGPL